MPPTLRPRLGKEWKEEATHAIELILSKGPLKPLRDPGCWSERVLDLTTRRFDFHKRSYEFNVTLNRTAMIHFLRTLRDWPQISAAGPLASFRDCALQAHLYEQYINGDGHLVAPPGKSFHQTGRSIDLYLPSDKERTAMLEHGFFDLLPYDPPHFTLGERG
jgi:hypothetical protein